MRAAPGYVGDVRAAGVDRAARVDDRGTGRHLRVRDLLGPGRRLDHLLGGQQLTIRPAMTSGDDAGRAVLAREVDERDHRRELELGRRLRDVAPHRLVAMQPLLLGAGTALQQMAEVELIARARGRQDAVAQGEQQRMAHDVDREGPRDAGHARDLLGERAVERLHDRVEQRLVGIRGRHRGFDLGVDARDHLEREQPFDDRGAVAIDGGVDRIGFARRGEPFEGDTHRDARLRRY